MLVVPSNAEILIKEFKEYVRSPVREISEEAIKAVGFCARTQEGVKMVGMGILMKLLKSNRGEYISSLIFKRGASSSVLADVVHLNSQNHPSDKLSLSSNPSFRNQSRTEQRMSLDNSPPS